MRRRKRAYLFYGLCFTSRGKHRRKVARRDLTPPTGNRRSARRPPQSQGQPTGVVSCVAIFLFPLLPLTLPCTAKSYLESPCPSCHAHHSHPNSTGLRPRHFQEKRGKKGQIYFTGKRGRIYFTIRPANRQPRDNYRDRVLLGHISPPL